MFDTGDVLGQQKTMQDFLLKDILDQDRTKIIYVYDFINMWTFLIELAAIEDIEPGATYPDLLYSFGELPDEAVEKQFEADSDEMYSEFDDDYDQDDLDMFEGDDSFEDFGFDENWN